MNRSFGVLVLPAIYFALCVSVAAHIVPSEGSWGWFLPFLAALPISIALLPLTKWLPSFIVFGVCGTLW